MRTHKSKRRSPELEEKKLPIQKLSNNDQNKFETENSKDINNIIQNCDAISNKSPVTLKDESIYKSGFGAFERESIGGEKTSYLTYDIP